MSSQINLFKSIVSAQKKYEKATEMNETLIKCDFEKG